ncbi:hypothetical protein [Spirillospora sp. NPDC048819]|uniref:hypothetical protein n=1 Tax=Spirillospora sp. NPDC048819 TaxID=3155268 RepID=UPI0033CAA9B6
MVQRSSFGIRWAAAVEPVTMGWKWYRTKGESPYVVIELYVLFVNGNGTSIGMGGAGQATVMTEDVHRYSHQLRARTLLDPADPAHRAAIKEWVAGPAPTMLFLVEEHFRATSYISMNLDPEAKQDFLRVLSEATVEFKDEGVAPGGFRDACALLESTMPRVSWWTD